MLAVGQLWRSASIAKRRIVSGIVSGKDFARSLGDFKSMIKTENLNKLQDGLKTPANIWTTSRMRTTLTLPRGTSGNGTNTTGSLP